MKIISYGAVCTVCLALAAPARAELLFHLNTSSTNIESNPNPKSVSKPAYPKYASVSFLQDNTKLDFSKGEIDVKTQCASLGYVISVSKCTGAMKPSKLCSAESSMSGVADAANYTTGCCNSNLYTALTPDSCTNNATSLNDFCYYDGSKKYRCSCDRARYPYSASDNTTCGTGGEFDVSDVCVAPNAQGQNINYYSGCCPNSYQECDAGNHEVGLGKSCRVQSSKGIITKYESCTCASHYDTVCTDGKLINVDNVCKRNGLNYTTESNCESLCTKTSETNIDDYLYGNVWHCLYENDGATLKETDEELKGKLCRGILTAGANSGEYADDAYNDCEAQGYTKSVDDCYGSDEVSSVYTIIHCPSDSSKVWCSESKYCTGYDVSTAAVCNVGANVKYCLNYDESKGIRCRYQESTYKDTNGNTVTTDCNSCWRDGVYVGGCKNYDDSDKGDSNHCCKLGYKMVNGKCVVNICNRTLYPYEQNPGSDQGNLEYCYQGDPSAALGYRAYFGYNGCKSDAATGGMWMQDPDNARKCVCIRKDELGTGRTWLPFSNDKYFNTNNDSSDNYTHVGFYKGEYGVTTSCTDSEGTYFGYESCYIGRISGTTEANKGMCLSKPEDNRYYQGSDWSGVVRGVVSAVIKIAGEPAIEFPASQNGHPECINKYSHCQSPTGEKLGDDSACALVVEGCNQGNEEQCNECYSVANLTKNSKGLYTAHNKFLLKIYSFGNTGYNLKFEKCPTGFKMTGGGGICTTYCSLNKLSGCETGFIMTDDGTSSGKKIGIVWYKDDEVVDLIAAESVHDYNWSDGMAYAADYYPLKSSGDTTFENHPLVGKGLWGLRDDEQDIESSVMVYLGFVYQLEGYSFGVGWWNKQDPNNADKAYYRDYWMGNFTDYKTVSRRSPVLIRLKIK